MDNEPTQSPTEFVFSACNDNDNEEEEEEEINRSLTEEVIVDDKIPSPPPSPSTITPIVTEDFDLVKHVLSEIFDKPNEENLDEGPIEDRESELVEIEIPDMDSSPPQPFTTTVTDNTEEDFRFLDEMLASIDVPDSDIHQLTPAEMDRVDSLLKQIVSTHQAEDEPSASATAEVQSSLLVEESPSASVTAAAAASIESSSDSATAFGSSNMPLDEELLRVEQEWSKLTEDEKKLGSIAPEWVSDDLAPVCMKCSAKFSITRRRHHCRACGKVFCSSCCWQKVKLVHDDSKEDRACNDCVRTINNGRQRRLSFTLLIICFFLYLIFLVEYLWNYMRNHQKPRSSVLRKKSGN